MVSSNASGLKSFLVFYFRPLSSGMLMHKAQTHPRQDIVRQGKILLQLGLVPQSLRLQSFAAISNTFDVVLKHSL